MLRITVAALMTTSWIARHLAEVSGCERIVIPGLCEGDVRAIEDRWGVRTEKGPADLRDLPEHFGQAALREEYGAHDIRIFAEINNVPYLSREEVVRLAEYYRQSGADVVDLGCSLDRKFDDVGAVVGLLKSQGFTLSIDTLDPGEILAADRAGVDYVLSLNGQNLDVAARLRATPILIPDSPAELDTLDRSIAHLETLGRPYIVDPVIEPDRLRLRGGPRPLRPGPGAPPRGGDADGDRQHHGADRRRHDRDERAPDRVLPGARHPPRPHDRGDPVGAGRGARGRRGAPPHVRRAPARRAPEARRRPAADRQGRAPQVLHRGGAPRAAPGDHRPELPGRHHPRRDLRVQRPDVRQRHRHPGALRAAAASRIPPTRSTSARS